MNYILLIIGYVLLIKGADMFVDGASSIAKKIGIPSVIVDLTIVSLGTSAPELAVSLISAINGSNEIAIGNVLGSNYLVFKSIKINVELPSEEDKNINIFIKILLIILGACAIILGGDFVVDSATNIAYRFGMSEKLVGLTIVAMGTSLPELVTSIVAALKGENDIALGNVLGSNIFNILLIIGFSSTISPITVAANLMIDFLYLLAITFFLFALIFIGKGKEKKLTRFEGLILVTLYIGYMIYIIIRN